MKRPETALYRCEQIRACERLAVDYYQIDEHELMARAGEEAFQFIRKLYPEIAHIAVYCGAGNNAGDGYVVARLAHEAGLIVSVYQTKAIADLPPAAQYAALLAQDAGVEFQSIDEPLDAEAELLVDALLGIGIQGEVHGVIAAVIHQLNTSGLPIISLDIPSGLNADTGVVHNVGIKADTTLTFIALKTGLYTADGPDYCGEIHCCPIGLDACVRKQTPISWLLNEKTVPLPLTARKKNSHKGDYGHVVILGGGPGMPGAVFMAAKAALRSGAGAVTVGTWKEYASSAVVGLPEAMVVGIKSSRDLHHLLKRATVCVLGPGLGETDWAVDIFSEAITSQLPMIIDASALRLLAEHSLADDNWILTPHPGEAAALLATNTQQIQHDRFAAASRIQRQYGGVVVLKGCGSIIQTEQDVYLCTQGNPAMASAGMGDVLSGVIAGLLAQGLSLSESAQVGVYAHAHAGDIIAQRLGGAGLIASDLIETLPSVIHGKL
ncbi:MAG: NAD(P)H-hydrate dehydratase [Legionella sp.]|nr:NAD(P)H-hydrate dehydratase [Legionella sp.]